ncbi:MAG: DUF4301 family protein, partial [Flavobacteriaceae bacterium]|nr:DUF4301 family protein [Flavobacteriaceae bacterium]
MNISETDIRQIQDRQQTVEQIQGQVDKLIKGLIPARLFKAATIDEGIERISREERPRYISLYNTAKDNITIEKFVPASGEATRMFKFLFEFLDRYEPGPVSLDEFLERPENLDLKRFHQEKAILPFFKEVLKKCHDCYGEINSNDEGMDLKNFVHTMLDHDKLNLSHLPKGLIPFHSYPDGNRTPFEEHLYEAGIYAASNAKVKLHFTISERHRDLFTKKYEQVLPALHDMFHLEYSITFSYQDKSTDTVAITPENELFRNKDGSLLFRRSGHGALLHNLNSIDADLVFIKNIDNVVSKSHVYELSEYKSMLAGYLIDVQNKTFDYLKSLHHEDTGVKADLDEILNFGKKTLNI